MLLKWRATFATCWIAVFLVIICPSNYCEIEFLLASQYLRRAFPGKSTFAVQQVQLRTTRSVAMFVVNKKWERKHGILFLKIDIFSRNKWDGGILVQLRFQGDLAIFSETMRTQIDLRWLETANALIIALITAPHSHPEPFTNRAWCENRFAVLTHARTCIPACLLLLLYH